MSEANEVASYAHPAVGSTAVDPEFLRDRVRLYLKILFLIDMGFHTAGLLFELAGMAPTDEPGFRRDIFLSLRWTITAGLGIAWAYCRHARPSRRALVALESVGTVILSLLYVHLTRFLPAYGVPFAVLMVSLAVVLRASLVPSTVRRTLTVGLSAVAAMALAVGLTGGSARPIPTSVPGIVNIWLIITGAAFVVVTAVTSRVIYGLRRQVKAAERLGQYELKRRLGAGGMGVVYEATHVLLRRPTAVKLLPIDKVGEQTVARFEREVRQTSRLEHPNSVFIYDYGRTPDGQFYYAMEYLDGLNLEELIEREGSVNAARACNILRQAARALAEAHAMGLVHRDIKPANIMLCDRGRIPDTVKVLDFGLVKAVDDEPGDGKLTQLGVIVGTPHYLAPEAIQDAEATGPPADVYALGAVGFFLLTGREVFEAKSVIEICSKHLNEAPVCPSTLSEQAIDPELDELILRCLSKDPSQRFQDGEQLAAALEALQVTGWDLQKAQRWWHTYQPAKRRSSALPGHQADAASCRCREPSGLASVSGSHATQPNRVLPLANA